MISRLSNTSYSSVALHRSVSVLSSLPRIAIAYPRFNTPDSFRRSPLSFSSFLSSKCTPRQGAKQLSIKLHTLHKFEVQKSHNRQAPVYKSQLNSTYLILAATLALLGSFIVYSSDSIDSKDIPQEAEREIVILDNDMVALPGRPGNLTPEEEIRLKQFWRMTFNVIGVDIGEVPGLPDTASTINEDISSLAGDKRRKSGFFARRKTESKPAVEEDKYGQTKEYQEALATTSPDEFRRAFWQNSKNEHPDAILLRFLRARKWDLQKALVMMISTLQWRAKTMKIEEEIVSKGELAALRDEKHGDGAVSKEGTDFLSQLRKGKSYVHGVDREGRPVTWVRVRLHHGGEQSDTSIERFTVQIFETTRLLIDPPADTGDLFFDMSGFSMANMDYTPVKFMIRCFEANYPESLGVCLIYKAPWIFQGVWKIISRWLDPVVASKIHFTNNVKDLDPWVDRSQIPQEMGGDSPYEYHYIEPREGENDTMKDLATRKRLEDERQVLGNEFERLTIEWIKGANVNAERQQMAGKMKQQYWKLDPYVRARTLYDRLGVLGPDGKVDWSKSTDPIKYTPPTGAGGAAGVGLLSAKDDSDNESLASFRTGNEQWEDTPSVPNGVAPGATSSNGIASHGSSKGGVIAGVATGAGAGAIGATMVNGINSSHHQPPATPTKTAAYISNPVSPTKSIKSVYSHAGTQTWNPRDASTQTMPQNMPVRGR